MVKYSVVFKEDKIPIKYTSHVTRISKLSPRVTRGKKAGVILCDVSFLSAISRLP